MASDWWGSKIYHFESKQPPDFHMVVCLSFFLVCVWYGIALFYPFFCSSIKHEYEGKWNDKMTRLTTCDPHAKRTVVNSDTPQEVEDKKEIIFTYDVDFEVRLPQLQS